MGKIFRCDIEDCPEWKRCLDKDELATRCPMYRMIKKNLPIHRYDKQVIEVNGKKFRSKNEAADAMGMKTSALERKLENTGFGRFGSYYYSQPNQ